MYEVILKLTTKIQSSFLIYCCWYEKESHYVESLHVNLYTNNKWRGVLDYFEQTFLRLGTLPQEETSSSSEKRCLKFYVCVPRVSVSKRHSFLKLNLKFLATISIKVVKDCLQPDDITYLLFLISDFSWRNRENSCGWVG